VDLLGNSRIHDLFVFIIFSDGGRLDFSVLFLVIQVFRVAF